MVENSQGNQSLITAEQIRQDAETLRKKNNKAASVLAKATDALLENNAPQGCPEEEIEHKKPSQITSTASELIVDSGRITYKIHSLSGGGNAYCTGAEVKECENFPFLTGVFVSPLKFKELSLR